MQNQGLSRLYRRSTATPPRASASRRRRSTTRSTTPSASASSRPSSRESNQYRVILEADPTLAVHRSRSLDAIYLPSSTASSGQVPLSADRACRASSRSRSRSTISASSPRPPSRSTWPRARRSATRSTAIEQAEQRASACRASIMTTLPGRGARLPGVARQRAVPDPRGDRHRLHRARRALRELHPPDHDPLDPAVGRHRRAAGAAWLPAATSASSASSASSC